MEQFCLPYLKDDPPSIPLFRRVTQKIRHNPVVIKNLRFWVLYIIFKEIDQEVLENPWSATTFKKERTKLAYSK